MTLYPGTPSDAPFLALVVAEALGNDLMSQPMERLPQEEQQRLKMLEHSILQDNTLYNWRNATVAKDTDGTPLGAIIAYPGEGYKEIRDRTFGILQDIIDFDTSAMEDETVAGEYYLDSISVSPLARGKGIGKELLLSAISRAKQLGLTAVLACDPENTRARALYESMGFKHNGNLFIFGHTYLRMEIER